MRLPDMVLVEEGRLARLAMTNKIAQDFPASNPKHARELYAIAEAQHEADMAYEVACPRCGGTGVWAWDNCCGSYTGCVTCGGKEHERRRDMAGYDSEVTAPFRGTGRVTLGGIVAADRARKAAM